MSDFRKAIVFGMWHQLQVTCIDSAYMYFLYWLHFLLYSSHTLHTDLLKAKCNMGFHMFLVAVDCKFLLCCMAQQREQRLHIVKESAERGEGEGWSFSFAAGAFLLSFLLLCFASICSFLLLYSSYSIRTDLLKAKGNTGMDFHLFIVIVDRKFLLCVCIWCGSMTNGCTSVQTAALPLFSQPLLPWRSWPRPKLFSVCKNTESTNRYLVATISLEKNWCWKTWHLCLLN